MNTPRDIARKKTFLFLGICSVASAVVFLICGCASVPKAPKTLACQTAPQWFANDAQGKPASAVFVCFGEDHRLLWNSRPLTLDELQKLTAPAEAPAPKAKAKK